MRINREILMKAARDTTAKMVNQNHRLVCVYLTGSMLSSEPMLGGTTDIDLVVIHDDEIFIEREIIPLNDDIHFDISHLPSAFFRQTRNLRVDPWIGSYMCLNPICLHDSQHWFEFTQAGICSQCDRPDYILQRSRAMSEAARQNWFAVNSIPKTEGNNRLVNYLKSLECAANAIALLSGAPLTERRFLLEYPERAEKIGRPGLSSGLIDMLMMDSPSDNEWDQWLQDWETALIETGNIDKCPPRLYSSRTHYYVRSAAALHSDHPSAALWILIHSWSLACTILNDSSPSMIAWQDISKKLGLNQENIKNRMDELDAYLDMVDETLDWWGNEHGVQIS